MYSVAFHACVLQMIQTVDHGSTVVDIDTILSLLARTSAAERDRFLAALACGADGATRPLSQHQVASSVSAMRAALGRVHSAFATI